MKIFLIIVFVVPFLICSYIYIKNEPFIKQMQAEAETHCYYCDAKLDSDKVLDEEQGIAYCSKCYYNLVTKHEKN